MIFKILEDKYFKYFFQIFFLSPKLFFKNEFKVFYAQNVLFEIENLYYVSIIWNRRQKKHIFKQFSDFQDIRIFQDPTKFSGYLASLPGLCIQGLSFKWLQLLTIHIRVTIPLKISSQKISVFGEPNKSNIFWLYMKIQYII